MGTNFCDVLARDVPLHDAYRVKERICSWLIADGIILPRSTQCVLGNHGYGFPPGPSSGVEPELRRAASGGQAWCGVLVKVGRYRSASLDVGPEDYRVECERCSGAYDLSRVWVAFCAASHNWLAGRSPTAFGCPLCGAEQGVAELRSDPTLGFGTLLFQWWGCWNPDPAWVERIGVVARSRILVRPDRF